MLYMAFPPKQPGVNSQYQWTNAKNNFNNYKNGSIALLPM